MDRIKKWIPAIIVMAIISGVSSVNGPYINSLGLGYEAYHINGHFILFMFLCVAYFKATKNIFNSIMLTLIFGIIDEFHQIFTPFRSSSIFDIFVDTAGGLISGGILWKFQHILPKRLRNWLLN
jgi:VanZ family protein